MFSSGHEDHHHGCQAGGELGAGDTCHCSARRGNDSLHDVTLSFHQLGQRPLDGL